MAKSLQERAGKNTDTHIAGEQQKVKAKGLWVISPADAEILDFWS